MSCSGIATRWALCDHESLGVIFRYSKMAIWSVMTDDTSDVVSNALMKKDYKRRRVIPYVQYVIQHVVYVVLVQYLNSTHE
jgi:hypothetical protein